MEVYSREYTSSGRKTATGHARGVDEPKVLVRFLGPDESVNVYKHEVTGVTGQ
jgi:hypothetical protein